MRCGVLITNKPAGHVRFSAFPTGDVFAIRHPAFFQIAEQEGQVLWVVADVFRRAYALARKALGKQQVGRRDAGIAGGASHGEDAGNGVEAVEQVVGDDPGLALFISYDWG